MFPSGRGKVQKSNDAVISNEDYGHMFSLQQESMEAPETAMMDKPENQKLATRQINSKPILQKPLARPAVSTEPAQKQIDTSGVKTSTTLRHKAFGLGIVKEISNGIVIVTFDGSDKKFQFPGAILQGFLSIGPEQ